MTSKVCATLSLFYEYVLSIYYYHINTHAELLSMCTNAHAVEKKSLLLRFFQSSTKRHTQVGLHWKPITHFHIGNSSIIMLPHIEHLGTWRLKWATTTTTTRKNKLKQFFLIFFHHFPLSHTLSGLHCLLLSLYTLFYCKKNHQHSNINIHIRFRLR